MRSPAWMVAYTVVLALLGATYATLVFVGSGVALIFALAALAAMLAAIALVIFR